MPASFKDEAVGFLAEKFWKFVAKAVCAVALFFVFKVAFPNGEPTFFRFQLFCIVTGLLEFAVLVTINLGYERKSLYASISTALLPEIVFLGLLYICLLAPILWFLLLLSLVRGRPLTLRLPEFRPWFCSLRRRNAAGEQSSRVPPSKV
jgi:hypothetical protein